METGTANILLVEDEANFAYVVRRYFESYNGRFNLTVAESIKDARTRLQKVKPDLIITDLRLPDGRGIELLSENNIKDQIPIVVVTGWGDEEAAVMAMKQGALDYVVKSQETVKDMPHIAERAIREWFNINQRRIAEEALRKANDELEKRVEKRTAELQRVNSALKSEIVRRKAVEGQIKASLVEKELLLKEIHHRVKNNLQFISSLLSLKSQQFEDHLIKDVFDECKARIRSMALVHEKLLQSKDFAQVDFHEYVEDLIHALYRSYKIDPKNIQLKVYIEEIPLGIDLAVPFGLIINELVSNSIKHAFPAVTPQAGKIQIMIKSKEDDGIEFFYGDNGVGLPKDFDFDQTNTLGLRLVKILAEDQLLGTLRVDRRGGTKYRIQFPKYEI